MSEWVGEGEGGGGGAVWVSGWVRVNELEGSSCVGQMTAYDVTVNNLPLHHIWSHY